MRRWTLDARPILRRIVFAAAAAGWGNGGAGEEVAVRARGLGAGVLGDRRADAALMGEGEVLVGVNRNM